MKNKNSMYLQNKQNFWNLCPFQTHFQNKIAKNYYKLINNQKDDDFEKMY